MSKRKEKTNIRLEILNEINQIDKRLKKRKIKENKVEIGKLLSRRNVLTSQLKTT